MSRLVIAQEGQEMVLKVVEDTSVAEDEEDSCRCGSGCAKRCYQKEYEELLNILGLDDELYSEDPSESAAKAASGRELARPSVGEIPEGSANGLGSQTEESDSSSSKSESFTDVIARKRSRAECKNDNYNGSSVTKRLKSTSQAGSGRKARKNSSSK